MTDITYREAAAADIFELTQLTSKYVGVNYRWPEHLGGGGTAREPLALVAVDAAGAVCGAIGVSPPPTGTLKVMWERVPGAVDLRMVPWWKVNVLAVDQPRRGQGIGRELVRETVRRLPRGHVGLYGNVEEKRTASISWYRRQGFSINPPSGLTSRERPGDRDAVGLAPVCGEVVFRGYRSILRDHLEDKVHPQWEERAARAEYNWQVKVCSLVNKPAADLGYRLYARRIANSADPSTCLHASMGPRPLFVYGWDPDHVRVCFDCRLEHTHRIQKYDADTHCDGCGNDHHDTRLSWAADDDHMLLIHAGLCPGCRSSGG
jgi:predicted N-acetyltransferase YhbS